MSFDPTKLLGAFKLWVWLAVVGAGLLSVGFTGGIPFTDMRILDPTKDLLAIAVGILLLIGSGVLLYKPPRTRRVNRPEKTISPTQQALFVTLTDWVDFDKAHLICKPENMPKEEFHVRIQLATEQGLLMRDVVDGQHRVKYRYADDKTTFGG